MAGRKKIEADYKDLEQQLDMHNKLKEDALKQLKKLQVQLKDATRDAEEARASRDELSANSKETERKLKSVEAELLLLTEELSASERARRVAESERDDFLEEMNSNSNKGFVFLFLKKKCVILYCFLSFFYLWFYFVSSTLMVDEKRRLEARIATLEEELEEEQTASETANERSRKAIIQIEQLNSGKYFFILFFLYKM